MFKLFKKFIEKLRVEINFRRNLKKIKKIKDPYLYK